MDYNDYFVEWLVKQRLSEARARAGRVYLAAEAHRQRRPLRVTIGTALIHVGAWLLRERYRVSSG